MKLLSSSLSLIYCSKIVKFIVKISIKNIEQNLENRYNIHGLSGIDSCPEANSRDSVSSVSCLSQR